MADFINFLDGKKTVLGILAWVVLEVLHKMAKIDQGTYDTLYPIVIGFTGIGVTDKVRKGTDAIRGR